MKRRLQQMLARSLAHVEEGLFRGIRLVQDLGLSLPVDHAGEPQGWPELEALLHDLAEPLPPAESGEVARRLRALIQTREPNQGNVQLNKEEALYSAICDARHEVTKAWWDRNDDALPHVVLALAQLERLVELYREHAQEAP